uniref:serine/threonine-protein kinase pim-2-like n=2 Tax=Scatophagus argus TaxID=75038 RepID=UPI001ED7DF90|nr:serine/threonine-protein kinase pim-2-like [Scatophagus argus]
MASTSKDNGGDQCKVVTKKRKACTDLEMQRKKQKTASNPIKGSAEAVLTQGTKRKSSFQRESPSKKQRVGSTDTNTNTAEPSKVSEEETSVDLRLAVDTPRTSESSKSSSTSNNLSTPKNWIISNSETASREFEAKYLQLNRLGEGGFGSVYAGIRKADYLPVAIKHIPQAKVKVQLADINGETHILPTEVLLMKTAAGGPESVGKYAATTLLDWYDLDHELVLVMERPVPSVDLWTHLDETNGYMAEAQAKNIMKQLVDAAIQMHSQKVFHRDIKANNILLETGSDVPRVRIIDFGCGCIEKSEPYNSYSGTLDYAPPEYYKEREYKARPTTVWQLGTLLYELLHETSDFSTQRFLRNQRAFVSGLNELKVSQDCLDLLKMCLTADPDNRATLEELQQHPWFT